MSFSSALHAVMRYESLHVKITEKIFSPVLSHKLYVVRFSYLRQVIRVSKSDGLNLEGFIVAALPNTANESEEKCT